MAYLLSVIVIVGLAALLTVATRTGIMLKLSTRPALILCAGVAAGTAYQVLRLPELHFDLISDLAGAGLAALVFVAGLQFRVSRLGQQSKAALRLATIAAPLFMVTAAIAAFVMLPSMSIWSALLLGGALMLNGAAIDRRAITMSSAPARVKATVELESAAALVFGLPLVIVIELLADAPFSAVSGMLETGAFHAVTGFAIGGLSGLLGGKLCRRYAGTRSDDTKHYRRLQFAFGAGIAGSGRRVSSPAAAARSLSQARGVQKPAEEGNCMSRRLSAVGGRGAKITPLPSLPSCIRRL